MIFPLRRIVKCGICNTGLTGGWSKGRSTRYPYYRCAGGCTKSIKLKVLDDAVVDLLKHVTPKEEAINLFISRMYKVYHERYSRLRTMKDRADTEIVTLQETRRQLVREKLIGYYSDDIF